MKGLKIIPVFLLLIVVSYCGTLFIDANPEGTIIRFFDYSSPPAKLGLVVLTSILIGMSLAGFLCSIEILTLHFSNRTLRKKLAVHSRLINTKNVPSNVKPISLANARTEPVTFENEVPSTKHAL